MFYHHDACIFYHHDIKFNFYLTHWWKSLLYYMSTVNA